MDSLIRTFHIDWKIILAQAVNFAVVLTVLYFFALKPLLKLLRERNEKIKRGVENAESSALLVEKTQKDYEAALARARAEAQAIFEAGKAEAEAKRQAMLQEAKADAARAVEVGQAKIKEQKEKMVGEAKSEIVSLALLAAEKLLRQKGGSSADEKLLEELGA